MATRLTPLNLTDENGVYTVFQGKHCMTPGCGVQLTSRNRPDAKLLCIEHARLKNRLRKRAPRGKPSIPATTSTDPREAKVYAALAYWLRMPTELYAVGHLQAALRDFELFYRFSLMKDVPEIPVEEPDLPNPEHRTTRPEFLVECAALNV